MNIRESLDLTLIFLVTLLSVMGVSLVSPSLPEIQHTLGLTTDQTNLIIVFFTLPGMLVAPLIGIAADQYGRKRLLTPSLLLFGVAGGLIPFMHALPWILTLRFLQGLGGAGLSALAVTLIGDKFKGEKRAKYIGWNASILSVGTASYPIIGGLLTDAFTWAAPFYVFSIAIIIALLVHLYLETPEMKKHVTPLSVYFGQAFHDLLRPLLLASLLLAFFTFILIYGALLTYLAYYLSDTFLVTSFQIGLVFSMSSISTGIVSSQTSLYQKHLSPPMIFTLGFFSFTISFLFAGFLPSYYWAFVVSLFFGAGVGIVLPNAQVFVISNVPVNRRAGVTSILTSITRGGQTVGPLFASLIFTLTHSYTQLYFALSTLTFLLALILLFIAIRYK